MNKCKNCGKDTKTKFCSPSCSATYNNLRRSKETSEKISQALKRDSALVEKVCPRCGKTFTVKRYYKKNTNELYINKKERKTCSRSCDNKRKQTNETKRKIKEKVRAYYGTTDKFCKDCGKLLYRKGNTTGYCIKCVSKHRSEYLSKKAKKQYRIKQKQE